MSITWSIETFAVLESTQDLAKSRAEYGAPEGHVIHAINQKKAYGRYGRPWISLEGNLFFSAVLRPHCSAQEVEQISIIAGLALAKTMREYLVDPEILKIKPPNDILLNGKKVAGILIETQLSHDNTQVEWVVIGMGVNLAEAPEGPFSALNVFSIAPVLPDAFLKTLLRELRQGYSDWQGGKIESIKAQWVEWLRPEDK